MDLSVIIPVYNEAENIAELHREVAAVCEAAGYDFEIVIVDDGSTDGTAAAAATLQPLHLITFRRNFGQTAAIDAGIRHASNTYIVTMDGDLQNDPTDIPRLLDYLVTHDVDVVSGWRRDRKDGFAKHVVSRGANLLRKILINDGIHDSGCTLKAYRRECFENLRLYGEMHRFIPALLKIKGFRIGEIVVNHRPRVAGTTKYTWSRTVKGFIDMITVWFWNKYSARPLHLLGGMGLALTGLGVCSGVVTIYNFTQGQGMSETAWPILTMFLFLSGLQLFVSGLIIDILLKSHFEQTGDCSYTIKGIVSNHGAEKESQKTASA